MGLFDSVYAPCAHCGSPIEYQSKADEDPYMNRYTVEDAPAAILWDVMNAPVHCQACDGWTALIDPRFPGGDIPRPELKPAAVRTPKDYLTHPQGMKWWPHLLKFSYEDLEEPPSPHAHTGLAREG